MKDKTRNLSTNLKDHYPLPDIPLGEIKFEQYALQYGNTWNQSTNVAVMNWSGMPIRRLRALLMRNYFSKCVTYGVLTRVSKYFIYTPGWMSMLVDGSLVLEGIWSPDLLKNYVQSKK